MSDVPTLGAASAGHSNSFGAILISEASALLSTHLCHFHAPGSVLSLILHCLPNCRFARIRASTRTQHGVNGHLEILERRGACRLAAVKNAVLDVMICLRYCCSVPGWIPDSEPSRHPAPQFAALAFVYSH